MNGVLFLAHAERVAEDIRMLEIRQRYLSGKVWRIWDARMNDNMELAEQIAIQNLKIVKELK